MPLSKLNDRPHEFSARPPRRQNRGSSPSHGEPTTQLANPKSSSTSRATTPASNTPISPSQPSSKRRSPASSAHPQTLNLRPLAQPTSKTPRLQSPTRLDASSRQRSPIKLRPIHRLKIAPKLLASPPPSHQTVHLRTKIFVFGQIHPQTPNSPPLSTANKALPAQPLWSETCDILTARPCAQRTFHADLSSKSALRPSPTPQVPRLRPTVILTLGSASAPTQPSSPSSTRSCSACCPSSSPKSSSASSGQAASPAPQQLRRRHRQTISPTPCTKTCATRTQVFSGMLAADRADVGISWHNQAENAEAEIVSGNYFDVLGLHPALGRLLNAQDDTAKERQPVLVLGYDYWKTHFTASHDIIGQTCSSTAIPSPSSASRPKTSQTAIGGYKPGVFFPSACPRWPCPGWPTRRSQQPSIQSGSRSSLASNPASPSTSRGQPRSPLALPPRRGADPLQKRTERFKKHFLDKSHLQVKDDSPASRQTAPISEPPSRSHEHGRSARRHVRHQRRHPPAPACRWPCREMSMRYALGASRTRIVSQLLIEGGILGVARRTRRPRPRARSSPRPSSVSLTRPTPARTLLRRIDSRVLAFTLGISFLVSLLFSLAPVLPLHPPRNR